MAEQALALARSRAETDLADEIDAWLTSYRVSLR
jgi:hypothetical protein